MSALQKLQEKITQWKHDHEALKSQNNALREQLAGLANSENKHKSLLIELEAKEKLCETQEETIISLQTELKEKDEEIEKIIAQVEALLS